MVMTSREGVRRSFDPLRRESTVDMVARRLREGIIEGTIQAGVQLSEAELSEELGVSRGPTREAIQRLIQEGVADSRPYKGVFVIELRREDVLDLYVARDAIEQKAVAILLAADPMPDLGTLDAVLVDMENAVRVARWGMLSSLDMRFHNELVRLSGSKRLVRMFSTLIVETAMCMQAVERSYPERLDLVHEHRRVLETIRLGRFDDVQDALSSHFRGAVDLVSDTEILE